MSMDFGMERCLQSDSHQNHMVDADWIVKHSMRPKATPTCVSNELCRICNKPCRALFWGFVVSNITYTHSSFLMNYS